jgi:hypothetical protein
MGVQSATVHLLHAIRPFTGSQCGGEVPQGVAAVLGLTRRSPLVGQLGAPLALAPHCFVNHPVFGLG